MMDRCHTCCRRHGRNHSCVNHPLAHRHETTQSMKTERETHQRCGRRADLYPPASSRCAYSWSTSGLRRAAGGCTSLPWIRCPHGPSNAMRVGARPNAQRKKRRFELGEGTESEKVYSSTMALTKRVVELESHVITLEDTLGLKVTLNQPPLTTAWAHTQTHTHTHAHTRTHTTHRSLSCKRKRKPPRAHKVGRTARYPPTTHMQSASTIARTPQLLSTMRRTRTRMAWGPLPLVSTLRTTHFGT